MTPERNGVTYGDAAGIASELRGYRDRIEAITSAVSGKPRDALSLFDVEQAKASVTEFKRQLKEAAKGEPATPAERFFLYPALRRASAGFRLRANTSPRNPSWLPSLFETQGEFRYYLGRLHELFPELNASPVRTLIDIVTRESARAGEAAKPRFKQWKARKD